jgi:hypothetical protein
MESVFEAPRGR